MTRRELREHIFRLLFLAEFYEGQELHEQTELYLDKLKTAQEKDLVYLREKTDRIEERLKDIDALLGRRLQGMEHRPDGQGRFKYSATGSV